MSEYFRPLTQIGPARPPEALTLAGGWCWFTHVEVLSRTDRPRICPATDLPAPVRDMLADPRPPFADVAMDRPALMGILNVTPDSFSDGGNFKTNAAAVAHATQMVADGADIIDVGGESTRPGAEFVPANVEVQRTVPVITAIRCAASVPISIDTRKAAVARMAFDVGARIINDVSALSFDPHLIDIAYSTEASLCLMHAAGDPKTMQKNPEYDDVLLDVFDYLGDRIRVAEAAGIPRKNIVVDPGIGFGKTIEHNLILLRNISLFHSLGCPILLGASRKKFIGTLTGAPDAADRLAGSVAVTLAAVAQGVQIHRVHDVKETRQALTMWSTATGEGQ
ncbi:MAG: dihydropteroate synthase [Marinosulfonomonas sp.]|nr:dihydropteroate synthase [Marinosulfonomonas sp.]